MRSNKEDVALWSFQTQGEYTPLATAVETSPPMPSLARPSPLL